VQFTDTVGGTTSNLGSPVTVSQGQATVSTSTLAAGPHSFRAVFTPSDAAAFTAATSAATSYTVTGTSGPVATTVTLAASPSSPSPAGTAVTFTATLSPSGAAGTVSFTDAGSSVLIGGGAVAVSNGQAQVTTSALSVGTHQITASFAPADPAAFSAAASQPLSYVITDATAQPASTTTVLDATPDQTAAVGADVTLTATITPAAAGTIQFVDAAAGTTTSLAPPVEVQGGTAQATVRFSTAGPRVLRAVFTPAQPAEFASSASADLAFTVSPVTNPAAKPTKVWLTAWPTKWCPRGKYQALGDSRDDDDKVRDRRRRCTSAVLVARVSPRAAAGTVQFTDTSGDSPVSVLGEPVTVRDGWAVLVAEVAPGRHTFAATFTPADPSAFQASTSNEIRFRCRKS
jgi:hypothetical protein